MDISSLGSAGAEVISPTPPARDSETTETRATERDRDPAPLPPTSGTVVDTTA
ncbi:MAG: hypothetical protein WCG80_05610 [Spirochaetales bacterium]